MVLAKLPAPGPFERTQSAWAARSAAMQRHLLGCDTHVCIYIYIYVYM